MGLARLSASSVGLVATINVHAVMYYTVSRRERNLARMVTNEENFSTPCCWLFFGLDYHFSEVMPRNLNIATL